MCGTPIREGSLLCPRCEEKEAARKTEEAALLAKKEAEATAKEKARQEAEAASERERQEKESTQKAQEAATLAQKEAKEEGKTAASFTTEEKNIVLTSSPQRRSRHLRGWQLISSSILLLLILGGIVYLFTLGRSTPEQDDTKTGIDTITNTTITDETTTTTTDETISSQTLGEILARTAAINSVKYDTLVTEFGAPAKTMRTWEKGTKIRIETTEENEDIVILVNGDAQTVYRYVPAQNTAERKPYPSPARTATQAAESILNFSPDVAGTEIIDGKDCLTVEYLVNGAPTRMWLWQDYGFPLRVEETVSAGIIIVEYSNIDFANIPDSAFELPPGVQIIGPSSPLLPKSRPPYL